VSSRQRSSRGLRGGLCVVLARLEGRAALVHVNVNEGLRKREGGREGVPTFPCEGEEVRGLRGKSVRAFLASKEKGGKKKSQVVPRSKALLQNGPSNNNWSRSSPSSVLSCFFCHDRLGMAKEAEPRYIASKKEGKGRKSWSCASFPPPSESAQKAPAQSCSVLSCFFCHDHLGMAKEAAFLVSHGGSPAAIERASFVPCVTFLSHNIVEEVKSKLRPLLPTLRPPLFRPSLPPFPPPQSLAPAPL